MGVVDQSDAPDGYIAVRESGRHDEHICVGCAFSNDLVGCYQQCWRCNGPDRADNQYVIFKDLEEKEHE